MLGPTELIHLKFQETSSINQGMLSHIYFSKILGQYPPPTHTWLFIRYSSSTSHGTRAKNTNMIVECKAFESS
jgi:hypothetical protein